MEKLLSLDPESIDVGWRARKDLGDIDALTSSIQTDGQLQPIVVRRTGRSRYELVAGMRRLSACKELGREVLAREVTTGDAAQAIWLQIVENVQRKDFSTLELGEGLAKHDALWKGLHPETRHGGAGSGRPKKKDDPKRFSKEAADRLGVGETMVKEALKLARELPEKRKRELRALPSRDRKKAERQELSRLRKEKRVARLVERAASAPPGAPESGRLELGDNVDVLARFKEAGLVFSLVLTDPPYGLRWTEVVRDTGEAFNRPVGWDDLDLAWVGRVAEVLADDAAVLAFCPGEMVGPYAQALVAAGLTYRGFMVWWKTNPPPMHRPGYVHATEHIVWATKGRATWNPFDNAGTADAQNVLPGPICTGGERIDHPTQKPEWLIDRLLDRHAALGEKVLDPFAGVGTTLVCCKRRGLWCAGIEREEKYYRQAKARIEATPGPSKE